MCGSSWTDALSLSMLNSALKCTSSQENPTVSLQVPLGCPSTDCLTAGGGAGGGDVDGPSIHLTHLVEMSFTHLWMPESRSESL